MIRLEFKEPLTALEIRKPAIAACTTVATEVGWYAKFHQPVQSAFDGPARQRGRKRIGNGNHKDWFVDYQQEPLNVSRPTILGRIALLAPIDIARGEYGGFDYGKYPEPEPTYNHLTVQTTHEHGRRTYNIPVLSEEVVELTNQEMVRQFARLLRYDPDQLHLF